MDVSKIPAETRSRAEEKGIESLSRDDEQGAQKSEALDQSQEAVAEGLDGKGHGGAQRSVETQEKER